VLANLQEVLLGTKLAVLFFAVPLAVAAQCFQFGQVINCNYTIPLACS
jgi:Ca2+:H+ antiporter